MYLLKFILELNQLIRKSLPDIVHFSSTNASVFGPLAVWFSKFKRPKIIYTAHGFPFNEPGVLKKGVFAILEKVSALMRDKTICVSESDRESGIRYAIGKKENLITIHNGIDLKQFKVLPRMEARKIFTNLPLNSKLIGTISQFYSNKGLIYLIKAAPLVLEKHPEAYFAIVGGGEEKENLESEIKEYNLEDHFFVLPYQEDGSAYLSAFDIIAAPSLKEGLPYFLIEAALAKIPVVSTLVGGIPEIIENGKGGLLVRPKNPRALSEAILKLINDQKLRESLADFSYKYAREKFNLGRAVQETEEVYLRLTQY